MLERSSSRSKVSYPVLESTQHHLASLTALSSLARGFSLLGDPTRLKILLSLAHAKELCVSDLADIVRMETSAISHQLRKLRDGGLVTTHREGLTIYYLLNIPVLRETLATARALLVEAAEGGR